MNFSNVKGITIPDGEVKQITENGTVLWHKEAKTYLFNNGIVGDLGGSFDFLSYRLTNWDWSIFTKSKFEDNKIKTILYEHDPYVDTSVYGKNKTIDLTSYKKINVKFVCSRIDQVGTGAFSIRIATRKNFTVPTHQISVYDGRPSVGEYLYSFDISDITGSYYIAFCFIWGMEIAVSEIYLT